MNKRPDLEKGRRKGRFYWREITFWYSALMLTVFLFYCGGDGFSHITRAKFTMYCLLSGGYVAAMAAAALGQLLMETFEPPTLRQLWRGAGWPQRLIVLYLGLTWLSALCSPYWPETVIGASRWEGALTITLYGLCFLLVSAFGRPDRRLLAVLGASVTAFCLLCLVQLAGGNPFRLYPEGLTYADAYVKYSGAYLGTIGNVDMVAGFLSLVIPILAYSVLRLSGRLRFLLLVPLGLALWVLVRMSVLSGFVGAAAGCAAALPAAGARSPRLRRRLALGLLVLTAVGLGTAWAVDLGGELFHQLHQLLRGEADASFGTGRGYIWSEVLKRVPDRLLLGAGPDTMLHSDIPPFTRYDEELGRTITAQIDAAHNEYLNILYHQGIGALAAYLGALALLAAGWVRAAPENAGAAILGAGVLGCCAQAFFGISMCVSAPFFWLALGCLGACLREDGRSASKKDKKRGGGGPRRGERKSYDESGIFPGQPGAPVPSDEGELHPGGVLRHGGPQDQR